ncbi:MAG: adenylate/guanylate cyclase domain-containing protein [Actinomycetota bacterium]
MDASTLDRARRALEDHAWQEAYEAFMSASLEGALAGEDLERLAEASWWTAHPTGCIDGLERAFAAHVREGNEPRAAYVALQLADRWGDRLSPAQSAGWFQRAARLLASQPERVEHGYLELAKARSSESVEEMMQHATAMLDIGTRYGDPDLQAFGLMCQGMAHIAEARVEEGMALIDEATVAAVAGELTPIATGVVYCFTIVACIDLADYRRAGEWTEATRRWCERQAINGFPGHCRVRQAEIMRLRGSFTEAEHEARRAVEELTAFGDLPVSAVGFREIGEIRLRIGDLDGAEKAFGQAQQRGNNAQPGLALLQLARGHSVAARSSIRSALAEQPTAVARARLLPSAVEIALASHDVAEAREVAEELGGIAASYDAALWQASAHQGLGSVLAFEGDAGAAIGELRTAIRLWKEADLPFETAQARRCLATAHRLDGDESSAELELRAAHGIFDQLGAALEAQRCLDLIDSGASAPGQRVGRTFMFTDIVGSTNLLETIGDEAWEGVMRWHNETLSSLIEGHEGVTVHTTGDGYFAAFGDATAAATCAVAIQRTLAEHRRVHGFAPQVRIGLHAAEAMALGDDYAGIGVHEAARVGALAEASEIVVTCSTVEGEPMSFPVERERAVSLKGLAGPVRVVSLRWQPPERSTGRS